ncbi:helix-turn-helix transcriptional regulator [Ralstonia pseudosolanacearum]|uniref:helix-turn-helix transcriptional regulator n=1 Tax=Ralstonia pseudosolanacearum TaxID=1310165 RepID=UPI002674CA3D|nr:AlpA family phage regulatory protein [Ralstonia pseudosolanacearum]MDO3560726.1 AlpA family phage regulatory protein [Ralstonia pseudosolanacearum]MDO3570061.1 AlpA family phage regulatory protein [Ralstonia pseudosolanacearum]
MDITNVNSARVTSEELVKADQATNGERCHAAQSSLVEGMFAQAGIKIPVGARVLRIKEVVERTGLSRSTVYVLMKSDPTFPKKVGLSARTTGVIEHQLDAWIASRAAC